MPKPPPALALSPILTIEDVCEAAARRSADLSEETRQVSDSLVKVLRLVTKSEELPADLVPTLKTPPAMPEPVRAIAVPEVELKPEPKSEPVRAVAVPQEELKPKLKSAPPPPVQPAKTTTAVAPQPPAQNGFVPFKPAALAAEEDPSESPTLEPLAEPIEQPALGPNEVYFPPGQLLFNKGDGADNFFVIRKGNVALFEPTSQKEIAVLPAGVSFGEQAILVGGVRSVSARSVDGVICLALSAKTLRDMLEVQEGSIKPVIEALLLQLYMRNDLQARGHEFSA
jgi:hypothetical protein